MIFFYKQYRMSTLKAFCKKTGFTLNLYGYDNGDYVVFDTKLKTVCFRSGFQNIICYKGEIGDPALIFAKMPDTVDELIKEIVEKCLSRE